MLKNIEWKMLGVCLAQTTGFIAGIVLVLTMFLYFFYLYGPIAMLGFTVLLAIVGFTWVSYHDKVGRKKLGL